MAAVPLGMLACSRKVRSEQETLAPCPWNPLSRVLPTVPPPAPLPVQQRGGRLLQEPPNRDAGCWGSTHGPGLVWATPGSSCFPWAHFSSPTCFAETCQRGGEIPEGSPLAGQHPGKAPCSPLPSLGMTLWHRSHCPIPPCPRSYPRRESPLGKPQPPHLPPLMRANEVILSSFAASPQPAHTVRRQEVKVEVTAQL